MGRFATKKILIPTSPLPLMELFACPGKKQARVMTVIQGIPFYCSTGRNSGEPNTWFPHRGKKEGSGWIMKPLRRHLDLPEEVVKWCENNSISHGTLLRWSNLQALCISASIGGGLWQKNKGKKFQQFLIKHYPWLFIEKEITAQIQTLQANEPSIPTLDISEVNPTLYRLGSLIPLNVFNSRLYTANESKLLAQTHSEKIKRALTMLLIEGNILSTSTYQAICWLSEREELFDYALENYLFEDANQVQFLNALIEEKKDCLSKIDLININLLSKFPLPDPLPEFLKNYISRYVLRLFSRHETVHAHDLALIETLQNKNLLSVSLIDLLANNIGHVELIDLFNNNSLTRKKVNQLIKRNTPPDNDSLEKERPGTPRPTSFLSYLSMFASRSWPSASGDVSNSPECREFTYSE